MCIRDRADLKYTDEHEWILMEGHIADLTIYKMNEPYVIKNNWIASNSGWTAFDGVKTTGWPVTTIVNGNIVYENEELGISNEDFIVPEELSIPIDCINETQVGELEPIRVEENLEEFSI